MAAAHRSMQQQAHIVDTHTLRTPTSISIVQVWKMVDCCLSIDLIDSFIDTLLRLLPALSLLLFSLLFMYLLLLLFSV